MELHELRPPDLSRLASAGEVRRLSRGPRTISEVLTAARTAMEAEDEAERRAADPVTWLRAERRRRSLFWRLFGRR